MMKPQPMIVVRNVETASKWFQDERYLKVGGILAVNNSHGDAGLASIDPDYEFIGVIQ